MPPAADDPLAPRGARWPGALLLLAAGAGLGWWVREIGAGAAADAEEEGDDVLTLEETRVRVEVATVQRGEFSIVQPVVGTVLARPAATWTIASRAWGRVLEAPLAAGQRVEQGALLVRFDPAPLALAVENARAARARAASALALFEGGGREQRTKELEAAARSDQAELDLASSRRTRLEPLLAQGLVSEQAVLEARQGEEKARAAQASSAADLGTWRERGAELERASLAAELAAAEASVADAAAVLAEAEVRAPAAGHLARYQVRAGELLAAGSDLGALLLGPGQRLVFGVAPGTAVRIAEQGRAWWTDARGATHAGRVQDRAPGIDPDTGLLLLGVLPDAPDAGEPLGAVVHGEIELEHLQDVLLVPERAVIRSHDETSVVRVDAEGRAHSLPIRLLGRRGGLAAVAGELQTGEQVVTAGGYNLPDGAHVLLDVRGEDGSTPPGPEAGEGR